MKSQRQQGKWQSIEGPQHSENQTPDSLSFLCVWALNNENTQV
jgi:hypothetical protein